MASDIKILKTLVPVFDLLFIRHLDIPRVDPIDDIVWGLAIYCAANTLGRAENLLRTASQVLC